MQQQRGRQRKLHLIRQLGGACQRCGYMRNHAALTFHHRSPKSKSFQLDLRNLSNRTWQGVLDEVAKCDLLCSNCHLEVHNPECTMTRDMVSAAVEVGLRRRYVRRTQA
jgi:5-methylcytosine-specific restriction endonuclease McrA